MHLLDSYLVARRALFDFFDFDGQAYEVQDLRNEEWDLLGTDTVRWGEFHKMEGWDSYDSTFAEEIYNHNIFRKEDYTLVVSISPFGDGNSLMVFDNKRERDPED